MYYCYHICLFLLLLAMEAQFSVGEVIEMMKRTKKTDPLFKPLKKLKTAIEGIGENSLSLTPTKRVIVFHFGLGNDIDRQLIQLTNPRGLTSKVTILPGRSYTVLHFVQQQAAQEYLQQKTSIGGRPVAYTEVQYQNLSRTLVFLYCKADFTKEAEAASLPDCPSAYQNLIPGLLLYQDILSRYEEAALLGFIDGGEWQKLNNRRVQHFGYRFKYGRNQIDRDEQQGHLPEFLHSLLAALKNIPALKDMVLDQLTINDYFAGDGIPAHFDTHSPFEQPFLSVSLLSGLVMDFRRYDGEERTVYLPPRSVAIFLGEVRFAWTHGITCRKVDLVDGELRHRSRRLSLTFRKIKFTPCHCPYYFYCDSQGYDQQTMKKNNPLLAKYLSQQNAQKLSTLSPKQIELEYVLKAYNGFGFDFHNKVIPQVKNFMEKQFNGGDFILDIGCGNGQYSKYLPEGVFYVGVEQCRTMAVVQNGTHMDCLNLAFRSNTFDKVLLIAVLHHFASHQTRLQALIEAGRVLREGGILYLTVLSYKTKKDLYSSPQTLLEYCLPTIKIPQRSENKAQQQMQQPRIESRGQVFKRYYHLFTQQQITSLLKSFGLLIVQLITGGQNIIVKAIKNNSIPQNE